jgi:hypothetical protein
MEVPLISPIAQIVAIWLAVLVIPRPQMLNARGPTCHAGACLPVLSGKEK